jgi:hypothetical protein
MAHDKEYEYILMKTKQYLTRGYNVGDGVIFTKTPLEVADMYSADQATAYMRDQLDQIQRRENSMKVNASSIPINTNEKAATVGVIDKARVAEAKERLRAFQQEKKKT